MSRRDFNGKAVIVTGAAQGLGRSLCMRFGAAGASIAALDRDGPGLAALAHEMQARGQRIVTWECDVTDAAACSAAISEAQARLGRIDVLVSNAGISHRSEFAKTDLQVIRQVMAVNFMGAVHCTHAALAGLRATRGLLVVISSVAGFSPLIGRTGYAASKHALHGFFDSLRTEVADDGIGVMLVCPSFIDTGIDRSALGGDGRPAPRPRRTTGAQMTPDAAAQAIYAAACAGRRHVLLGGTARLAWWISRCSPRLYAALMKRRLQAEIAAAARQGD